MRNGLWLCATLFVLLISGCSDETTVYQDQLRDELILENNETKLQSSIVFDNSGVLDLYEEGNGSANLTAKAVEQAGDYPLTLVAQVAPPVSSAGELTASHVVVADNLAFVSYNQAQEGYAGALEIIDVGDPANPRVTSRLVYINADINSIRYEAGFLYAAGGVDAETSATATSNSFLAKIPVNGSQFDSNGIIYGFQQGFNANDLQIDGSRILVTSGKDGSLAVYSKSDLALQQELAFADLRSVAISNGIIALLDASLGIRVLDSNLNPVKEIPINSDFGFATKKTIDFKDGNILVAEGDKGTGVYSLNSGALLEYIPILVNPAGVEAADIVTNAVATNEGMLMMANGGAGLCLSETGANGTDIVGIIELEGSINYVASREDYAFAASGKSGLQIIKLNRPSASLQARCEGLPPYEGSSKMIIQAGENASYSGSKRFNNVNISGSLLLCGTWTVKNSTYINDNAIFEMKGSYAVGKNNSRKDIVVGPGAVFRVEGDLTIYGDLILEDGASLEFVGSGSTANIFGDVDLGAGATVTGEFEDTRNKF